VIQPWTRIASKPLGDFRIFSVRSVTKRSPRTGAAHEFFIIDSVNWVNVIALTPDRRMILVGQYRQGSDTVELEIPGGMIDPADSSPEAAAVRELREETGFEGEKPCVIGQVFPNPAIMSNTCFTVLVENCKIAAATRFDQTEDLITKLVPVDEVSGLVASGKIRHCLVVAALFQFELWRQANTKAPV
jgi:8-oxo-dGTP pyrophosphatase MutT (NUDIX family)